MDNNESFLSVKDVADKLKMNPEVVRRWFRSGKLPGIKISHKKWLIKKEDFEKIFNTTSSSGEANKTKVTNNCTRFPRWVEYSGLPSYMSKKFGLSAWVVFKKLLELDRLFNKKVGEPFEFKIEELAEITGLTRQTVYKAIRFLKKENYIKFRSRKHSKKLSEFAVVIPIRTVIPIELIPCYQGGLLGKPLEEVEGTCIVKYCPKIEKLLKECKQARAKSSSNTEP